MFLSCLRVSGRHDSVSPWNSREHVGEELFGEERLAQDARSLVSAQDNLPGARAGPFPAMRLKDNAHRLMQADKATAAAAALREAITPAAEWLLGKLLSRRRTG